MGERVRHQQRGTEYEVLGLTELQIAYAPVMVGSKLDIFRSKDSRLWAREVGEFRDGRFETITPGPDPEAIAQIIDTAAETAEKDAVEQPSDERAVAQAQRTATYRRFAVALRDVETRKVSHG